MKKLLTVLLVLVIGLYGETTTIASDNAGNYGGGWTNGSNGGFGFGAWTLASGGNAGHFIGDPTSAGISGMSASSFGLWANPYGPGNWANAERSFTSTLAVGQTFSIQWGVNWDSDGAGNKGFNLYSGGITEETQLININQGGLATITINGNPMFVMVQREMEFS